MNSFAVAGALLALGSFVVLCVMPALLCLMGQGGGWRRRGHALAICRAFGVPPHLIAEAAADGLSWEDAIAIRRVLEAAAGAGAFTGMPPERLARRLIKAFSLVRAASARCRE